MAFDVIIVGAGLAGLSMALGLSQAGVNVCLLEKSPHEATLPCDDAPFDTKVVAITRATERLLDSLGVFSAILGSRVCAYQFMHVWDEILDGEIVFSASELLEPNLGYMIEQRVICGALWQALKQAKGVTFKTGVSLTELEVTPHAVKIKAGETLEASLLIGADGANSQVRARCGIDVTRKEYGQHAIVATVRGEKGHGLTAFERFANEDSLALLPLSEPNTCSIVWACAPPIATDLMQISEDAFNSRLTRESGGVIGDLEVIGPRRLFPLTAMHAKRYASPRCVLVGDAAHTVHPLAGQGANLGFSDVATLLQLLTAAKSKKRDLGALSVLQRYERRRRIHNQMMLLAMGAFKQGFASSAPFIQFCRNKGLNWVNHRRSIKRQFAKIALGTWGLTPLLDKGTSHAKKNTSLC